MPESAPPTMTNVHTIAEALEKIRPLAGIPFRELDPSISLKDGASNKAEARNVVDRHVSGPDAP